MKTKNSSRASIAVTPKLFCCLMHLLRIDKFFQRQNWRNNSTIRKKLPAAVKNISNYRLSLKAFYNYH